MLTYDFPMHPGTCDQSVYNVAQNHIDGYTLYQPASYALRNQTTLSSPTISTQPVVQAPQPVAPAPQPTYLYNYTAVNQAGTMCETFSTNTPPT